MRTKLFVLVESAMYRADLHRNPLATGIDTGSEQLRESVGQHLNNRPCIVRKLIEVIAVVTALAHRKERAVLVVVVVQAGANALYGLKSDVEIRVYAISR